MGERRFPTSKSATGLSCAWARFESQVLETPGHTPESICLVITDEEKSADPWAVLTGDTLFVGDVGRPDLSANAHSRGIGGDALRQLAQQSA